MKWYGVICCEFDGSLENIEVEADFKPAHESAGFSFCKWFKTEEKRNKTKDCLSKTIKEIQMNRAK